MKRENDQGELKFKRMLILYERLTRGHYIQKQAFADEFNVSKKAIQRDLEEMRFFVEEYFQGEKVQIKYIKGKGYFLKRENSTRLTGEEVMLLSKVLLESRAFPKSEMKEMLDKIIAQCEDSRQAQVYKAIRNESFLYQPVGHNKLLSKTIGDLNSAISEKRTVTLHYMRSGDVEPVTRLLEPLSILFSEYYFYLIANISGLEKEYPAVYRLDRIQSYSIENHHFRTDEKTRFQEGEFRKQIQFMQMGKLMHVKFRFWGHSIEAITDRLPNAIVNQLPDASFLVEAKVFGRGIKMWLLSQAEFVEVIAPLELKEDMATSINKMASYYR
ncbi:helix-turn-helix transcriptional regulator [Paenibacillus sp. JDR-2]|uniref:helix-turn-helix transcriptional regulator n=1 Tax=Paenibacillus sp. (strain JDR-2) TaxID=324057 RepID=UPI0001AAF880|nr:WYL domain-containing protein [Paenibacillus sp. JDR-2]ACT00494.1 Helix-turn-helix type 11 domain protein [Paenibacillus sp. JDR-2]